MGGSTQSYCFFPLEKGVMSVYTWSFLLEYFQSYPDPEGGLFIREKRTCWGYGAWKHVQPPFCILILFTDVGVYREHMHLTDSHWWWVIELWAAAVRWYLNFLICFPIKKLHFFTVFFSTWEYICARFVVFLILLYCLFHRPIVYCIKWERLQPGEYSGHHDSKQTGRSYSSAKAA